MATDNGGGSVAKRKGLFTIESVEELAGYAEDLELLYYEARAVIDEGRMRTGAPAEITDREWIASLKQKEKVRAVGDAA